MLSDRGDLWMPLIEQDDCSLEKRKKNKILATVCQLVHEILCAYKFIVYNKKHLLPIGTEEMLVNTSSNVFPSASTM